MFVLGNLVITVARLSDLLLEIMYWLIIIRALISWVNPDPFNVIVQFLHRVTEPILDPVRRWLPPTGIDVSPIIAIIGIWAARSFLVQSLFEFGVRLKM